MTPNSDQAILYGKAHFIRILGANNFNGDAAQILD